MDYIGKQIKVHGSVGAAKPSNASIEMYLQHMVVGIGPAIAKRIVDTLGERTMEAIENNDEKMLRKVGADNVEFI